MVQCASIHDAKWRGLKEIWRSEGGLRWSELWVSWSSQGFRARHSTRRHGLSRLKRSDFRSPSCVTFFPFFLYSYIIVLISFLFSFSSCLNFIALSISTRINACPQTCQVVCIAVARKGNGSDRHAMNLRRDMCPPVQCQEHRIQHMQLSKRFHIKKE